MRLGNLDDMGVYTERHLLLAEGLNDSAALSAALRRMADRYATIGAPAFSRMIYEDATNVAREHDLLGPLGSALVNLAALLNSRDLPAAMNYAREAHEVARRSGDRGNIDFAIGNHLTTSWQIGDMTATASALCDALDTAADPIVRAALRTIEVWLADATGAAIPEPGADILSSTDDDGVLAWQDSADLTRALATGDTVLAAGIATESITHVLGAFRIEDDFCVLWPPLVLAALAAGDLDLAQRLLEPVEAARPGQVSPAVAAHWHRLRGLASAARGDDPEFAETEMRAGITALDTFGAHGYRAQAQEELARWLVDQHRPEDAQPLIDAARNTYTDIGATGWLARLDAWDTSRQPSRTP